MTTSSIKLECTLLISTSAEHTGIGVDFDLPMEVDMASLSDPATASCNIGSRDGEGQHSPDSTSLVSRLEYLNEPHLCNVLKPDSAVAVAVN